MFASVHALVIGSVASDSDGDGGGGSGGRGGGGEEERRRTQRCARCLFEA